MDAYERSLKQQAERIRRELSQEGKKAAPVPKVETPEEFIPSDVPSPIYGYARPKPKINLPSEHSPETRADFHHEPEYEEDVSAEESFVPEPADESMNRAELFQGAQSSTDVPEKTEESKPEESSEAEREEPIVEPEAGFVTSEVEGELEARDVEFEAVEEMLVETEVKQETVNDESNDASRDSSEANVEDESTDEGTISEEIEAFDVDSAPCERDGEQEEKTGLGDVSILEDGFASVFFSSTDLTSSKVVVRDEKEPVSAEPLSVEETTVEDVAPIVEDVAKTLQTAHEQTVVEDEVELTPAVGVSYKAEGPPLNVMMTPQDRMAMYRKRRLEQKNNNL